MTYLLFTIFVALCSCQYFVPAMHASRDDFPPRKSFSSHHTQQQMPQQIPQQMPQQMPQVQKQIDPSSYMPSPTSMTFLPPQDEYSILDYDSPSTYIDDRARNYPPQQPQQQMQHQPQQQQQQKQFHPIRPLPPHVIEHMKEDEEISKIRKSAVTNRGNFIARKAVPNFDPHSAFPAHPTPLFSSPPPTEVMVWSDEPFLPLCNQDTSCRRYYTVCDCSMRDQYPWLCWDVQ
ncbi:uncharacterized protein MONOS_6756p2 [Monocercomonoides exilis]|uniref:uncharacterized protein n=1 Tax=Monocercomonoides exilis TaxID=2049356 RepID=UPI0035593C40|nr:hypothetical protein MONOS_6756p2 [Monocercomonoides exilis]